MGVLRGPIGRVALPLLTIVFAAVVALYRYESEGTRTQIETLCRWFEEQLPSLDTLRAEAGRQGLVVSGSEASGRFLLRSLRPADNYVCEITVSDKGLARGGIERVRFHQRAP